MKPATGIELQTVYPGTMLHICSEIMLTGIYIRDEVIEIEIDLRTNTKPVLCVS